MPMQTINSQAPPILPTASLANKGDAPNDSSYAALIYSEFGGASVGHTLWLIIPAAILSLISCMGILMNGSLIYVTARSKYVLCFILSN